MNLDKYIKKLKVKVENISEKQFKQRVDNIYKELNSIHEIVRKQVKYYLIVNAGRTVSVDGGVSAQIPKVRTGNLVKTVARHAGKVKENAPQRSQVGSKVTYSFTNIWAMDNDGSGGHTVLKAKTKAPYAHYLNTKGKFSKYNDFLGVASNVYGLNFRDELKDSIKRNFTVGTFRY